jgi:hypothetical protein
MTLEEFKSTYPIGTVFTLKRNPKIKYRLDGYSTFGGEFWSYLDGCTSTYGPPDPLFDEFSYDNTSKPLHFNDLYEKLSQ